MDDAHRVVETVARDAYGRLISYLSARSRDVAGAEDALAEAFLAALRTWPCDGVPEKPEAWLLATARHRLIDRARHERIRVEAIQALRRAVEAAEAMSAASMFPDERLKLLFVCAHPAIDPSMHTPLMLQIVLGLDAATIARAFLVSPATLGQRLVRAKAKIRDAGIAFEVPGGSELPQRLGAVLEAIYAAYGSGWDDVAGADPWRRGLTDEAIWLARVLLARLPEEPEARGLLALMLYCEARRQTRRAGDGGYVPLSEQDTRLWSMPLIEEAERLLAIAAGQQRVGRFQLEAAIQSAHVERARCGRIDWQAIALLYEGLVRAAPTLGALVGRAAALAEASGPDAGFALLDDITPESVQTYQPYWAVRAHLLQRLGRRAEALDAFDRAISLTEDSAIQQFLLRRRGQRAYAHGSCYA
jgi:predicted RNA polymerase sigma factor